MDIHVSALDPADDAVAGQALEMNAAAAAADVPDLPLCPQRFLGGLRHPWPGDRTELRLAHLDAMPVGYLELSLPQLDNLENASAEIVVHPEHRRRGVGRALHEEAVRVARDHGRKRLMGHTVDQLPGGPTRTRAGGAFAAALGAESVLAEVRRRLDVSVLEPAVLDRLLTEGWSRAAGYALVQWMNEAPEQYVDDVAYLDSRLLEDAPMGDLAWEPEKVDAKRVRDTEAALDARGSRRYHSGIRHEATGQLVAWTTLDFGATVPWHAFQQITIVEPRHRGHRLGAIVKIENLRFALAHEPDLRVIDTWNAAANDHMIAINEAMGFRPVDSWNNWQQSL
jgi:GNAT superfamily N-acetyltransferase